MNLYLLVEGRRTERQVYRSWLTHVFPKLREVRRIEDVTDNHFLIVSGYGYPSYMRRITAGARDIEAHGAIDLFLICIDAEENTLEEKLAEVEDVVPSACRAIARVIVHDCCIESWFLGHRKVVRRQPERPELRRMLDFYDVVEDDPEAMPCMAGYSTRARFHEAYLREVFRERGLAYSKDLPRSVQDRPYLEELVRRRMQTGHLASFGRLLEVWQEMGAEAF